MATATIDRFLSEIAKIVQDKNGVQLQQYLVIEPPLPPLYTQIVTELRQTYPEFNQAPLEEKCKEYISEYDEGEDGGSRISFISFLVRYFVFMRDVNVNNLVETHDMLKGLLNQCILVLSSYMGLTVLPTVISFSKSLARLAIGLDKRPDLVATLVQRGQSAGGDEGAERITLVESTANVIREAFKKCLSERSGPPSGVDSDGRPEGRRIGIYLTANLCLKLFFHCRKLRSAEQIFGNIYQQSPPLSLFPASQRVTFLYYLGRYLFANNHFFRAQLALQSAYDQCHPECISQRRSILTYLITANIILGRFPSAQLYARPEAAGLRDRFHPLCTAIARGDLCAFRRYLDLDSAHADWFIRRRILLQLANRCEVLVWRSLARRTFLLSGSTGDPRTRAAPTLRLDDLLIVATYLEKLAMTTTSTDHTNGTSTSTSTSTKSPFPLPAPAAPMLSSSAPPGPFSFLSNITSIPKTSSPLATNPPQTASPSSSPPSPPLPPSYICPDLAPDAPLPTSTPSIPSSNLTTPLPTLTSIESIVTSLVNQDLIHGFISHGQHRVAITGTKNLPPSTHPAQIGFPRVWDVVTARVGSDGGVVPGWVRVEEKSGSGIGEMGTGMGMGIGGRGVGGGGMVVNLSGARPAGAAPG